MQQHQNQLTTTRRNCKHNIRTWTHKSNNITTSRDHLRKPARDTAAVHTFLIIIIGVHWKQDKIIFKTLNPQTASLDIFRRLAKSFKRMSSIDI